MFAVSWLLLALRIWQALLCGHAARNANDGTSAVLLVENDIAFETDIKTGRRSPLRPPPPQDWAPHHSELPLPAVVAGPPTPGHLEEWAPPEGYELQDEAAADQAAHKYQERLRDKTFKDAEASKQELDNFGQEIADEFGGRVSSAPIKGFERASEKVAQDYADDWFGIKDIARLSIVLPDFSQVQAVVERITNHFSVDYGGYNRAPEVKEISAETDPLGYSGTTVFVTTKAMVRSEIQINSEAIIYAKVGEGSRKFLGDDLYSTIESASGVQGGQGHLLYEVWRAPGRDDTTKHHVETVSKAYYSYFRKGKAYWGTDEGRASAAKLIELLGDSVVVNAVANALHLKASKP